MFIEIGMCAFGRESRCIIRSSTRLRSGLNSKCSWDFFGISGADAEITCDMDLVISVRCAVAERADSWRYTADMSRISRIVGRFECDVVFCREEPQPLPPLVLEPVVSSHGIRLRTDRRSASRGRDSNDRRFDEVCDAADVADVVEFRASIVERFWFSSYWLMRSRTEMEPSLRSGDTVRAGGAGVAVAKSALGAGVAMDGTRSRGIGIGWRWSSVMVWRGNGLRSTLVLGDGWFWWIRMSCFLNLFNF